MKDAWGKVRMGKQEMDTSCREGLDKKSRKEN